MGATLCFTTSLFFVGTAGSGGPPLRQAEKTMTETGLAQTPPQFSFSGLYLPGVFRQHLRHQHPHFILSQFCNAFMGQVFYMVFPESYEDLVNESESLADKAMWT